MSELETPQYYEITTVPPELVADIILATHTAYEAVVASPGGQAQGLTYHGVKRSPSCLFVANHVSSYLNEQEKAYSAETAGVQFRPKGIAHLVSVIEGPGLEEPILADATWQQFLPHRSLGNKLKYGIARTAYPDVLIGTQTDIANAAVRFGFSKDQASTWNPDQKLHINRI